MEELPVIPEHRAGAGHPESRFILSALRAREARVRGSPSPLRSAPKVADGQAASFVTQPRAESQDEED
jgi:hypothetical protein